MPERSHQTVTIRRGKHASPDRGACVVELASMLAGERFSDHPPTVCPVIAGFLRGYNDLMPEQDLPELYPIAARVVGSAGPKWVRRERARRLIEWSREPAGRARRRRFYLRFETWDLIALPAVKAALRLDPERRRVEVARLIDELVAIGERPRDDRAVAVPARDGRGGGGRLAEVTPAAAARSEAERVLRLGELVELAAERVERAAVERRAAGAAQAGDRGRQLVAGDHRRADADDGEERQHGGRGGDERRRGEQAGARERGDGDERAQHDRLMTRGGDVRSGAGQRRRRSPIRTP